MPLFIAYPVVVAAQKSRNLSVQLRVLNEVLSAELEVPDRPMRLDEALPLLRDFDDQAVELASRDKPITCRKGCSACCRAQPVPIAPQEAYAISLVVESLPEPRRSTVEIRFAANAARLRTEGLSQIFLEEDRDVSAEAAREIAKQYFSLGLQCPFLEDDACSIYRDRPFVCRQYLVTSAAELCADPLGNQVRPICVPLAPARASLRTAESLIGLPQRSIPLALALEYVELHREELERTYPPEELLQRAVGDIARKDD